MQTLDRVDEHRGVVGGQLAGRRERRELRPVADLVGQPPAEPGEDVLVAQQAVQPHRVLVQQLRAAASGSSVSASGPSPSSGGWVSGSPADRPDARPRARCRPRSAAAPGRRRTRQRASPSRGLAGCLPSGSSLSRPPCMRCTTKVSVAEVEQQVLAPAADDDEVWPCASAAGGTAVFSAVNVSGVNRGERRCRRTRSSSRSACACSSGSSGIDGISMTVSARSPASTSSMPANASLCRPAAAGRRRTRIRPVMNAPCARQLAAADGGRGARSPR